MRPGAAEAVAAVSRVPNTRVVLWSAGTATYVENVLDVVVLPAIHAINPVFYFARVLCLSDLVDGWKDLDVIADMFAVARSSVALVDDADVHCVANRANGYTCFQAPLPGCADSSAFFKNLIAKLF